MATVLSASVRRLAASARKRTSTRCLDSRPIILSLSRCRCYSTESTDEKYLNLPEPSEWRSLFTSGHIALKERPTLSSLQTAEKLVESFISGKDAATSQPKVVIEAFPGPGAISRALLKLPPSKLSKLIILEDSPLFLQYLYPLEKLDPRVTVVPMSGYEWETYHQLEEKKLLEGVVRVPWADSIHPQLHFISHLPLTVKGEQLVAQFFRCIPDHSWLYSYGRMPMSLIMGDWIWSRTSAPLSDKSRCKLSVIAEATVTAECAIDPEALLPYEDHFQPVVPKGASMEGTPKHRRPGAPLVAVNVVPHADQVILPGMLEKWDYCLRRLFVLRNTAMKRCISSLAPGAASLLKPLTDTSLPQWEQLDISKTPRELNVAEWALIIRAFDNWAFAPEDLLINDSFTRDPR